MRLRAQRDATWNLWDSRATEKWWEPSAPAKTRNTRNSKKTGLRVLIWLNWLIWCPKNTIARVKCVVKSSQSKSSDELRTCNIGSTSCNSGKSGYKTCEQEQEDIDRAIRWLRKRGQVVESVIQTATICPRKENSWVNLCQFLWAFRTVRKTSQSSHQLKPGIDRAIGYCACRFWCVIEESWGSSGLVIQIVAAKHVQSTQW